MKPNVPKIFLTSECSKNIVTFSVKETILHMVLNKSFYFQPNLHLDPDNPCPDPSNPIYEGEVNTSTYMK